MSETIQLQSSTDTTPDFSTGSVFSMGTATVIIPTFSNSRSKTSNAPWKKPD
ncbi:MAG TPA: hypothetical protein VK892_03520 [Pyrinomonadaceae bacterium]|nr:hypothetical protein [Pyrinomonadaceae bacterium]